jgi:hypothetical protein
LWLVWSTGVESQSHAGDADGFESFESLDELVVSGTLFVVIFGKVDGIGGGADACGFGFAVSGASFQDVFGHVLDGKGHGGEQLDVHLGGLGLYTFSGGEHMQAPSFGDLFSPLRNVGFEAIEFGAISGAYLHDVMAGLDSKFDLNDVIL